MRCDEVADRVAILNQGSIEQFGTPQEIYDHPVSPFVYNFLGNVNLFHGRLLADLSQNDKGASNDLNADSIIGFVRPHEFEISRALPEDRQAVLATIERLHAAGPQVRLDMRVAGARNLVAVDVSQTQHRELALKEGDEVFLSPQNIRVFDDRAAAQQLLEQGAGI